MTRTLTDGEREIVAEWNRDAAPDRLEDCSADDQAAYRVWCDLMDDATRAYGRPAGADMDDLPF